MTTSTKAPTARINLSPTIARDHESRGVFPELRPAYGSPSKINGGHFHVVTRLQIDALLADAKEQYRSLQGMATRGLKTAYNSFINQLLHAAGIGICESHLAIKEVYGTDLGPNPAEVHSANLTLRAALASLGIPNATKNGPVRRFPRLKNNSFNFSGGF